jgi:hypothetical protein
MNPVSVSVADVLELAPRTTPAGGVNVTVLDTPRLHRRRQEVDHHPVLRGRHLDSGYLQLRVGRGISSTEGPKGHSALFGESRSP